MKCPKCGGEMQTELDGITAITDSEDNLSEDEDDIHITKNRPEDCDSCDCAEVVEPRIEKKYRVRYFRDTTAYLEKAMNDHYAKANDENEPEWYRRQHRIAGRQLEQVIENDIQRATWHGKRVQT